MKFIRKISFDKSYQIGMFFHLMAVFLFVFLIIFVPDEWVNRVIAFILLYYFYSIKTDLMIIVYSDYEEDNE
jgi:hypothetical protein